MRVLFVTPELAPVLKSGGIGEGIAALVRELTAFGIEVTVALPTHPAVQTPENVKTTHEVVVIDTPELAHRSAIYGDDMHDVENAVRFATFTRAVVDLVGQRAKAGAPFELLHAHEWPCAMVPYLTRERRPEVGPTRSVLTLHNLAHQGIFPKAVLSAFGLGPEHASDERLGFHGHVNFLKGGILSADVVTTVSPTYARQILRPPFGEALEPVLARRKDRIKGLVNGIDYAIWNPRTDENIPARFHADDLTGKAACKRALLAEVGIVDSGRPLLVSVGRIVEQKGSDLLAAGIAALSAHVDVVVAGGGDPRLTQALEDAVRLSPDRTRYLGVVSDAMVHRLMAGADLVVMPSRFEPCGIVQLYAMRYGAIPIATRTGGLADTIEDTDDAVSRGTGLLYDEATSAGLVRAVQRAARAMSLPAWRGLVERAMQTEHSWRRRAQSYKTLYEDTLARPA